MRVGREALLLVLQSVGIGLAKREVSEQSTCFVFNHGRVVTFNDEIACSRDVSALGLGDMYGAVRASELLALLEKLPDESLDLEHSSTAQGNAELLVKGADKRAGVTMEAEVLLKLDDLDQPDIWHPLPQDFADAVRIVRECAGQDADKFVLTCVHITPSYMEACDNFQMARYAIDIPLPEDDVLLRADSLKSIATYDMTEIAITASWVHFRNTAGLVVSARRFLEGYPDLGGHLSTTGDPVTLPKGLPDAVAKAEVFTAANADANNVCIDLRPGKLLVEGRGPGGWYQERKTIVYNGPSIKFLISPKLINEVVRRSADCQISPGLLIIDGGKFRYVTCVRVA